MDSSRSASAIGLPTRFAWLPIPALLLALFVFRLEGTDRIYNYSSLRLGLSVIFYTAVSLATILLIGRSFLKSGKSGLLLLECGVLLWSLSGTIGDAVSHGDFNVNATIFNLAILLAGMCHLGGAALSLGPQRDLQPRLLWLIAGLAASLGAMTAITWVALRKLTPVFFLQNQGGTPERTAVLLAAITLFLISAILLKVGQRGKVTPFVQWYCFALLLLATGLFGIIIQPSIGGVVNWLARIAQWLGGTYLLVAAIVSVRGTGRWEVYLTLEAWDDRLLRLMTPYLLWTIPTALRYGLAILLVIASVSLSCALLPWIGTNLSYNLPIIATIGGAVLFGIGPALLTLALGNIAVEAIVMGAARTGFAAENYSRLAVSLVIGSSACWAFHAIRTAARKVQKSEARLAAFAEATFEGICEREGDLILDCNEQFARILRATRAQLIGTRMQDMVVPEDRERVNASFRGMQETITEHGVICRDGRRIVVEAHSRAVAQGSSRSYTAVRDITERIQTEQALGRALAAAEAVEAAEAERQRFLGVLETLPVIIMLLKPDYRVMWVNRAYRKALGDNVGLLCYESQFGRTEPCQECQSFVPLQTGEPHHWEWTIPNGSVYDIYNFRIVDADGSPMILTMDIDITDRRQAEKALLEAHEYLSVRAAQLRALAGELTLAEQRERSRLAKILHDHLQQLLVAAKFRIAVLHRSGDDTKKQAMSEVEALIDESISTSRSLTAELSPPILHEAGLNAGLQWLARRMTDRQGLIVELEMEEDDELPEDIKILLFESVRELLFNVVKHAHTRFATVNVRRIIGCLQLEVADHGVGFDPVMLPAVGEGGRGYGLFSIRERLELMGGTFDVASTPGQGSRFVLTVPVGRPAEHSTTPAQGIPAHTESPLSSRYAASGRRIRVMLADDHAVVRQGMANLLGNEPDIEVVGEAADGLQAVELAAKLLPDVILMDLSMPRLNGVEATRIIHKDWPRIRIIGLSMFEETEKYQAIQDAGAVSFLAKSWPAKELIDTIRSSFGIQKAPAVLPD